MQTQSQDISFLIKRINDKLSRFGHEQMHNSGMTFSQMRVISYLKEHQGEKRAQKDIEDFFGVSHPTVVSIIHRLEERGLIKSTVDTNDRRIKNLTLTPAGDSLVSDASKQRENMDTSLLKGLKEEEIEELRRLLSQIAQNL